MNIGKSLTKFIGVALYAVVVVAQVSSIMGKKKNGELASDRRFQNLILETTRNLEENDAMSYDFVDRFLSDLGSLSDIAEVQVKVNRNLMLSYPNKDSDSTILKDFVRVFTENINAEDGKEVSVTLKVYTITPTQLYTSLIVAASSLAVITAAFFLCALFSILNSKKDSEDEERAVPSFAEDDSKDEYNEYSEEIDEEENSENNFTSTEIIAGEAVSKNIEEDVIIDVQEEDESMDGESSLLEEPEPIYDNTEIQEDEAETVVVEDEKIDPPVPEETLVTFDEILNTTEPEITVTEDSIQKSDAHVNENESENISDSKKTETVWEPKEIPVLNPVEISGIVPEESIKNQTIEAEPTKNVITTHLPEEAEKFYDEQIHLEEQTPNNELVANEPITEKAYTTEKASSIEDSQSEQIQEEDIESKNDLESKDYLDDDIELDDTEDIVLDDVYDEKLTNDSPVALENQVVEQEEISAVEEPVISGDNEETFEDLAFFESDDENDIAKPVLSKEEFTALMEEELRDDFVKTEIVEESIESIPEKDTPPTFHSETSGFCWESYTIERLDSELSRATAYDQDLSFFAIKVKDIDWVSNEGKEVAQSIMNNIPFPDCIFEFGTDGCTAIMTNMTIEESLTVADSLYSDVIDILESYADEESHRIGIGISARSLRMISGERLANEAKEAMNHAFEDRDSPIVAFKVNPQKYRNFLAQQAEQEENAKAQEI